MIACTSISPSHINNDIQFIATKGWSELGLKVYSFNCKDEIEILSKKYPHITFIEIKTLEKTYGKPYASISAIFDWCKQQSDNSICLINSDIELQCDAELLKRIEKHLDKSIVLANRINYDNEKKGNEYLAGIDVFFINRQYLHIYPQSMYALGQCHFDYWIPYVALYNGLELTFIQQQIAFHKNHQAQYNHDSWTKTGRYFMWENNLYQFHPTQGIGQMSQFVYNTIYNNSKRIEI